MTGIQSVNPTLPYGFKVTIPLERQLVYDMTTFTIPGLTVNKTTTQYQNVIMNIPDDTLEVEDLVLTVILSDGLQGYKQLTDWFNSARDHEDGFRKDVTVIVYTGDFSEKTTEITFCNSWPTNIGSFTFDYGMPTATPMIVTIVLSVDGAVKMS